jgi:hypothetical protein
MVDRAFDPAAAGEVDAILMREMAANPDRGGHGVDRHAHALAGDVLGLANAGLAVDVDVAVPEHA